jgi:hypothetical protein
VRRPAAMVAGPAAAAVVVAASALGLSLVKTPCRFAVDLLPVGAVEAELDRMRICSSSGSGNSRPSRGQPQLS